MAKTSKEIGSWLLKNENLKGTPDFNFAVDQYKKAKERENNPFGGRGVFDEQVLGANNPEGTLLGRELKRGLLRSASTPFTVIAGSAASRLGEEATLSGEYGENNLLMDQFKEHSGLTDEAIANLRKSRGTDLSTPEGAANELTKMGYGPTRTQNFLDIYKTKLANAKALSEDPNKREAVIESGVKNITKANELNAAAASIAQNSTAQSFSKMHEEHGDNSVKQLLSDAFENPAGFGMYMTEIMVQSSPQIIAGLVTSALTKNPAAGVSVLGAGTFLQEYGPSVNEFLQNNGINKNLSKKEAVALLADRDLMRDAAKVGATRATMITLFEVLGMSAAGKGIMKNFAVNAAAGSGGEASAQLATQDLTGKPLNPREIVLEGLAEFGQAPFEAGIVGAGKVKNRIKSPYITNKDGTISLKSQKDLTPLEAKAYTSLANILKDLADAGGMDGVPFDLMDINPESKKGAKIVLDNAHLELLDEMNKMFVILGQKGGPLNAKQVESLEELKVLIKAQVARLEGRNKTKGQVGRGNYDALEALVGNTQEGRNLINTLMMLDALTQLDSKGLQGKLSTFTDTFSVSGRLGGKNQNIGEQVKSSIKPILSLGVASQTYGASILGQLAITRVGKAIDKKRGTYSVLDKYIKDNIKGDPLDAPTGPSILAAKALKDQENKLLAEQKAYDDEIAEAKEAYEKRLLIEQQEADAKEAAKRNLPPHPDSPQGTLENATGLNRAQVASILRILKRLPRLSKRMKDGITDYQQSVGKGGRVGPEGDPVLNDVIRHVAGMAEELGITPPRSGNPNQGGPANTQLETPAIARGIKDNQEVINKLTEKAKVEVPLESYSGPLFDALDKLKLNLGSDPEGAAKQIVVEASANGVPRDAVNKYLMPYVDRIVRQKYSKKPNEFQGEQVDTTTPPVVDQSIPVFDQTTDNSTALNQYENLTKSSDVLPNAPTFQKPPGVVEDEVEFDTPENPVEPTKIRESKVAPIPRDGPALEISGPLIEGMSTQSGNKHTLMPHLRVETDLARAGNPLFTQKTNNKNAEVQINNINEVLERNPDPAASIESWKKMMSDALADTDIPVPPYQFIKDLNEGGSVQLLSTLSEGQIADADKGFENAAEFRQRYTDGEVSVTDTGKLFLWSFLSRGVSPYVQESMFIDAYDGINPYIEAAADGSLNKKLPEYLKWAKSVSPKGSGQPGAGSTHNLNAFGTSFLIKMSEDAGKGDGRSRLKVIHDMMSDPESTGKEVRREFLRMGEGAGIDNKVVSFTLLVAGYPDVMVLDRVQMRQLWNDGRYNDLNLYDGYKENKKPVTGSALSQLTYGARGLMMYEALEQSLQTRVNDIYAEVGRPQDASIGRYHWDTWVASSNQEASHDTVDAILNDIRGLKNSIRNTTSKAGEYGQFAYGVRYGRDHNGPYFKYGIPGKKDKYFTVEDFGNFLSDIKKTSAGVIPTGFKVSDSGNSPWFEQPGVNKEALNRKVEEYGKETQEDLGVRRNDGENVQNDTTDRRPTDQLNAPEQGIPELTRESRGPALTSPALTSPDGNQLPSSPAPNVRRVKPYVEPAKKVFEIGKEGGKYEDGIGTLGEALELASALNLTVFFMNQLDTPGQSGEYRGIDDFTDAAGVRRSTTKATLKVLRSGANHPLFNDRVIDDISEFTTLMHEIAHGLTVERTDREQGTVYRTAENPLVRQDQALETAKVGSFEDFILDAVENYKDQVDVLQEIIDLQENIDVAIAKRPEWGTKGVRQMREVASIIKSDPNLQAKYAAGLESSNNEFRQTYLSTVAELAVDPMWVYLVNPKLLKSVAPKTAKAIRKTFNNFGGPKQPVTFYSYPLATLMAVVMAVLANMEQEEEERLRQPPPPPGALSPQMGALSA